MAWHLNRALTTMRAEVDARWQRRDKGSDGTIGDAAHAARTSDHNPDGDGSVDAWDMDVQLNGVGRPYAADLAFVIGRFMRHPAAQYVIYNRQIASRNNGWTWETYGGTNPHDKHVHFNTRSAYEDSTAPWGIEEDDVSIEDVIKGLETADLVPAPPAGPLGNDDAATNRTWRVPYALGTIAYSARLATREQLPKVMAGQAKLEATLAAVLAAVQGDGTAEILAKLDEMAAAERQRDADLLALVAQAQTGQLDAAEVVRLIGERLAAD